MAHVWYFTHDGTKSGPLSCRQLKDLADADQILPTDTVWRDGTAQGVLAHKVKYLFTTVVAEPAAVVASPVIVAPVIAATAMEGALAPYVESASLPVDASVTQTIAAAGPLYETPDLVFAEPTEGMAEQILVAAGSTEVPLVPAEDPVVAPKPTTPRPIPVRRARATAGRGAEIVGQDGVNVKFRKRCTVCPYKDNCWNTMRIATGVTRVSFFCPKCRKNRAAEVIGSVN
jgi:hypothetical protein